MQFLRFMQADPFYKAVQSEVVVSIGQIVKVEPVWFEETAKGERYRIYVGQPDDDTLRNGLQKEYVVYDSLGNTYRSEDATPESREQIMRTWNESV